jgi:hypothetical protein
MPDENPKYVLRVAEIDIFDAAAAKPFGVEIGP